MSAYGSALKPMAGAAKPIACDATGRERPGHGAWELDNGSAEGNGSANNGMRTG